MSKKSTLMYVLNNRYQYHRDGHPLLRKKRIQVMYRIVNELEQAGHLPSTWRRLTKDHIKNLIGWWRKSGLSISTMMNRLSVFRHFSQFIEAGEFFPDNYSVGLIKYSPNKKYLLPVNKEFLKNIADPIIRIIMTFEVNFGLTKKEIMRLIAHYHFFENKIYVTRHIAFNHKERSVPVLTEEQITAVHGWHQVISSHQCLLDLYSYQTLIEAYGHEMKQRQKRKIYQYRYFYAISRYTQLIQNNIRRVAFSLLQQEMGISNGQIRRYLREQQ
jgi:site-specific recombinase XerC